MRLWATARSTLTFMQACIISRGKLAPTVERAQLFVTDIEFLRLHYAETLRCWVERFAAHRAEIAQMYDERFCRMFEFYLGTTEMSFRHRRHMVFQLQLSKRMDAVPITRDYIEGLIAQVLAEADRRDGDRFDDAAEIFREVALGPDFPAFLTLPAYARHLVETD